MHTYLRFLDENTIFLKDLRAWKTETVVMLALPVSEHLQEKDWCQYQICLDVEGPLYPTVSREIPSLKSRHLGHRSRDKRLWAINLLWTCTSVAVFGRDVNTNLCPSSLSWIVLVT